MRAAPGMFDQFAALSGALEQAAPIARLDALLTGHPLAAAWLWRIRLDAVRHSRRMRRARDRPLAYGPGCRDHRSRYDLRGRPPRVWAVALVRPARTQAIEHATAALSASGHASPLIAAAFGVRAWLDDDGDRPALRAALAQHWQHCGLLPIAVPLTGAQAFSATPLPTELWTAEFLKALAEEADAGIALIRRLERQWLAARAATRGRRRDSHAAAAVDILAAAPIVSATSLAHSLDIAIKNAVALLDVFVARDIAIEVTHRSKRRLFGLKHLAPLRDTAAPPRRALRRHGYAALVRARGVDDADLPDTALRAAEPLQFTPLQRKEFEFSDLDDWMREADQLIRRSQAVLDGVAQRHWPRPRSDAV